jgi:hypothetical protein
MTIKTLWLYFLLALFFLPAPFLQAQNSGYFHDSISGETRFIQRLTWPEDEYARRYEVIIEREEEGEYRGLFQEFTNALFIQVHLLPGKYRCRVITHDYLNRPGPVPQWKYIEVLAVIAPEAVNRTDDIELVHKPGDAEPVQSDKVNLFLSAAWMPSFTISDGGNNFFERDMALCGASVRFGVIWPKIFFNINPGLELPVSYNFFNTGTGGEPRIVDAMPSASAAGSGEPAHLLTFGLNLLALKRLPGNSAERVPMALTFRLGAGYGLLFTNDASTEASFSGGKSFHINTGVSFLLFVMDNLYLETGLDYAHWFTSPASYYFRPWVGIGFTK